MNNDLDNLRLAFIDVQIFDESVRGGLLITDWETKPQEFRVTAAIKPTNFQRILHGATLSEMIYADLMCVPLLEAAKEKPSIVFVKNKSLLRIRPAVMIPVALLEAYEGVAAQERSGTLALKLHQEFPDEETYATWVLDILMQRSDPLEPFERVKRAIQEVHRLRPEDRA
jgi:hypothetical protein